MCGWRRLRGDIPVFLSYVWLATCVALAAGAAEGAGNSPPRPGLSKEGGTPRKNVTRRAVAPVGRVDFLPAKLRDSVASQAARAAAQPARVAAGGRSGDAAALPAPPRVSVGGLPTPSLVSADGLPARDGATTKTLPPRDPRLHSLGLIPAPPSKPARAQEVLREIQAARAAQAAQARLEGKPAPAPQSSPASHDNSAGLPPVGDQGAQGSCVSWATGYYVKSYQEKKERGWSLTDPAHQFSPAFLYNQLQAFDEGSTFEGNLDLLENQGCATLDTTPYKDTDYLTYPTATAYREGIPYRALSWDYLGNGETEGVFDAVKAIVSSGDVCAVGLPIFRPGPSSPGAFDLVGAANPNYDLPPAGDVYLAGYHALTIVGYDESRFGGHGGYKCINSWGAGWGASGFAWLSEPFLTTYGFDFHRLTDRIAYVPGALVHFKVSHSYWWYDNVIVTVGVGPTNAPFWSKALNKRLNRDGLTMDRWADLTEALSYLPPDWTNRWWIKIEDHSREDVANLTIAEIESGSTIESAELILPTYCYDNANTYIYLPLGEAASSSYYVNDDSTSGDCYCTIPGDDANDGLTPGTPKRTVQAIIDRYTLIGGNTVWIDTGVYSLSHSVSLDLLDTGKSNAALRCKGAPGLGRTVFQASSTAFPCVSLSHARYVTFEDLRLTGGNTGVSGSEADGLALRQVKIFDASVSAVSLFEAQGCVFRNVALSSGQTVIYIGASEATLRNCTVVAASGQVCVGMGSGWTVSNAYVSLYNNILTASGSGGRCFSLGDWCMVSASEYNDYYATGGATYDNATPTGTDFSTDPGFANQASRDYHLKSTIGRWDPAANGGAGVWTTDTENSPCIDAGDPAESVGEEPEPNGGRINIGAYGGTAFASKSPSIRRLALDCPAAGQTYYGLCSVLWKTRGAGWAATDTVRMEYSPNGGVNFYAVAGASNIGYRNLPFEWDVHAVPPGPLYMLRLVCNQDSATSAATAGTFTIAAARCYYVNDASTANDVYCVAAGSDANDGLTSAAPKASIQAVLDTYDLAPGDTVYVDTGNYALAQAIVVSVADGGSAAGYVRILGSPNGSVFSHLSSGPCVKVDRADYVWLEGLRCSGGTYGIWIDGLYTVSSCVVRGNVLTGNTVSGLYLQRCAGVRAEHNILSGNPIGITLEPYNTDPNGPLTVQVRNNTLWCNGTGISCYNVSGSVVSQNIVFTSGSASRGISCSWGFPKSDYNDWFATAGAWVSASGPSLGDWRNASGQDSHSRNADPRFADPAGGDFHLLSTGGRWNPLTISWVVDASDSPCIDAGDPTDPVGAEPAPNGGRINLGVYAGTSEASKSPVGRSVTVLSPNSGEVWRGMRTIRWSTAGQSWMPSDSVSLSYSPDSGGHWSSILGASGLSAAVGQFGWKMDGLTSGTAYRVRAVCDQDNAVSDMSDGDFTILPGGCYYVNDGSTTADRWCTNPGNPANDGLTPGTPKDNIQAILDAYDLEPGDTIFVDAGTYNLTADIVVGAADGGSAAGQVRILGVKGKTILDRGAPAASESACVRVNAGYVTIENLVCRNGYYGIYLPRGSDSCQLIGNSISSCGSYCIIALDLGSVTIIRNTVVKNGFGCSAVIVEGPYYGGGAFGRCDAIVRNNLVLSEGYSCLDISAGGGPVVASNIFSASGTGCYCISAFSAASMEVCDYNDLLTSDGAQIGHVYLYGADARSLSEWRGLAGWDRHSLSTNPLFANPTGGDYHLKSVEGRWDPAANGGAGGWVKDDVDSPCIDGGDPADSVGAEPIPNGGRINIGAYGGTAEASKSLASGRWLVFDGAGNREPLHAWEPLRWSARGANWAPGETVRLEVSDDSGGTWQPIGGAGSLACDAAQHWWDSRSVPDGDHYRFRVVVDAGAPTSGTAERDYAVHNLQAPWGPNPTDGATGVPINTDLGWNSAAGAAFYDVYLWKSSQTKPASPLTSVTATLCDPPRSLALATAYKWQVVARNGEGQTAGPEWTFTTAAEPPAVEPATVKDWPLYE